MRAQIKPVGIAAEALGILVDPAHRAPHLLDHGEQAAAGVVDIGEVENDVVRPRLHERLGEARIVLGAVGAPCPAMDEDVHRRIGLLGAIDVELLDLARSVGDALGRPDDRAGLVAVGDPALGDLLAIGRIDHLVIGVVERLLVHVEPDQRALRARLLRQRGTARRDGGAACRHRQDRAPRGVVVMLHGYAAFVIVPPVRLSTMTGLSNQVIVGLAP